MRGPGAYLGAKTDEMSNGAPEELGAPSFMPGRTTGAPWKDTD